ncbi:NusG domain II-containing protein [Thiohalorhabdus methylotrophus]|uniref:NusG domain II-containing protein n=1 Tax=Thiohalorhabdus methylotrophus TaxID=3242694 RepID=A0ABV4TQ61_9GAMM
MKAWLRFLRRATTPWDRTVLALVWVGAITGTVAAYGGGAPGARAEIVAGGEVVETVSLGEERELTVEGPLGTSHLRVRDGGIRFVPPSPAPRKIDLRAGWQRRVGDTAACVPNEVLVRVVGNRERPWDAINY